jgi:hypothetical protein
MATLASLLLTEEQRPQLVQDCCDLIDSEVRRKKGFKGTIIKGAYKTVKTLKRGFVSGVVDALLNDWVDQLEPHYASHVSNGGGPFADYVSTHRDDVAESLLSVTDERAKVTKHKRAKGLYLKLRPSAKSNVGDAVPRLAEVVDRYVSTEG